MRIRHRAAAAALALSVFVTVGALHPNRAFGMEETGSIQGMVVAADGGAPLPAALVVLDGTGLSATTGADGAFAIDDVTAGAYRLTVTREAFAELALPVTVVAGQPVLLDLRLAVLEFEESVVVTATQTERAVTEVAASVTILDSETIEASSARNLQDLLRRTPGFDLAETSGMAARANSSLVIRGVPGTKRALFL
ncbi:MAG: TonB-dependent receptor, partial [Acidobacteria bacterium]|nr:TonB-dependent receptor [Acidobacteriota bacterium]